MHLCKIDGGNKLPDTARLFSEGPTRWLVELREENREEFEALMQGARVPAVEIGHTTEDRLLELRSGGKTVVLDVENLYEAWSRPLWDKM